MTPPELEQVMSIVQRQAWNCLRRLPQHGVWNIEDLINEGVIIYYSCVKKHTPSRKANFSTFLDIMLRSHYANLLKKEWRVSADVEVWDAEELSALPDEGETDFRLDLGAKISLSSNALRALRIVPLIETPTGQIRINKESLRRALRERMGMSYTEAEGIKKELLKLARTI